MGLAVTEPGPRSLIASPMHNPETKCLQRCAPSHRKEWLPSTLRRLPQWPQCVSRQPLVPKLLCQQALQARTYERLLGLRLLGGLTSEEEDAKQIRRI